MIIHLVDGTYELFRHFYGARRFIRERERADAEPRPTGPGRGNKGEDAPLGAVFGVLGTVLQMIETGATHLGVATDHVIESFRNELWSGYKTGDGIEPALWRQFHPLEEALAKMGVATWPMVELEADDGLASAAHLASLDPRVEKVSIWTPDKDLAQCVRDDRVVQVDRRSGKISNAAGVREKFGVAPEHIPDFLALVGDSADGYPGLAGIGKKGAAQMVAKYGPLEDWPVEVLGERREVALLFKRLATLRVDAPLFGDVEELRWVGPRTEFEEWCRVNGGERVLARATTLAARQKKH